ncbi:putative manganese efflux pump MntP [Lysobacter bugurensis]|uniref:Putative manganese efflux pump MntP n=2 Tax=Cognatilysobacter bugurensis TaxID=543356 RepID=A0A918T137_9GAMM|nr:putative manganese efflux pump MntP [Lysobacter bugurensis]
MSADAFAAAVGKGAAMTRPRLIDALRIGLVFGVIEAITPLLGGWLGQVAQGHVEAWDHWIALVLLTGLGVHMIRAGLAPVDETAAPASPAWWRVPLTGLATSIDAFAVGVGLAFVDVPIGVAAAVIGACTFVMVTFGVLVGRALGVLAGKRAEVLGGLILILVGIGIAVEHVRAG